MPLFPYLLALLAGMTMAVQGSLNSALGKVIGLLETTFVVHFVGSLAVLILLALHLGKGNFSEAGKAPFYFYAGGLLGVLIVYTVAASIPKLGVAVATTVIIVGQVTTALIIDHFGLFGLREVSFTWLKGLGLLLLATGARLLLN